jgi:hypothetical protein
VKLKGLLKRLKYAFFPPATLYLPKPMDQWLVGVTPEKLGAIYRQVFNTPGGRTVIADLEAKYSNRSTVLKDKDQPIDVSDVLVREGERRVLLRIKNLSKEE